MAYHSTLITQNFVNPILNYGNKSGVSFFQGLLPALVNLGFVAGAIIFLFNLIMGGIQWISAGGDKGKLEAAREHVTNAVIGIAVLFSAYALLGFIEFFFSVKLTIFNLDSMRLNV